MGPNDVYGHLRSFASDVWGERFPLYLPGIVTLGAGLVLAQPFDTFGHSPAFDGMARCASEAVWAAVLFAIGVVNVIGVGSRAKWCPAARITMYVTLAFVAGSLAFASGYPSLAVPFVGCWAILAFWGRNRVVRR